MFDLISYLDTKRRLINDALNELLESSFNSRRIVSAMKYSLMAGGKRIRPVLCIAASEAVNRTNPDVLRAACALELIHTYSLIHDDLPAMDNDDQRRCVPTCHIRFDEATAILAGDALLTMAFQVLSSTESINKNNAMKWIKVMHVIAYAAGYEGMIEGQMRDISSEGCGLTLDELQEMHSLKTGALIEASISVGAILGCGSQNQIDQLEIYSKNIGLAFQVADDIINVEGDPLFMGKAAGTDEARQKSTYPSIMGIEDSKKFAKKLISDAHLALADFDGRADPLRAIAAYIIERKC